MMEILRQNYAHTGEHVGFGRTVRILIALSLVFLGPWLLNQYAFSLYDVYWLPLRDVVSIVKGVSFLAMALIASKIIAPFAARGFVYAATASCVLCVALLAGGAMLGSAPLVIIAALVGAVGSGLVFVMVGILCLNMRLPDIGIITIAAFAISYAERLVVLAFPPLVTPYCAALACLAIPLILWNDANGKLDGAAKSSSIQDALLSHPTSFISFGSQIFVCMFMFRFMYGIALTLGESNRTPVDAWLSGIPLLLIAVYIGVLWKRGKAFDPDFVFRIAALLVLAGLLLVPATSEIIGGMTNSLLYAGSNIFDVLSWFVLIAIGSRNYLGSISVLSWGSAMTAFGVVAGANLGRVVNAEGSSPLVIACVCLAFVTYIVYFVARFKFSEAIRIVEPIKSIAEPAETVGFAACCIAVGKRFDLTPREQDIFELLARGRNGHFIQDELVISYNTVKTHVAHIYDKMGIHSQQELIDMVETEAGR